MARAVRSDILLALAAVIWGFAFVAQRIGSEHVGPLTFNAIRFLIGIAFLLPVAWLARGRWAPSDAAAKAGWRDRGLLAAGVVAGIALFAGSTLQQWGVGLSTAGKSGFITGLYVVFVPVLGFFLGRSTPGRTWLGAALAVAGLYLLAAKGAFSMRTGDLLVLAGAVCWAFHVTLVARYSRELDPLRFAVVQFAVCALMSAALMPFESPTTGGIADAAIPLLYGGALSVAVAFTLQVVGQKDSPPAHAAIILSTEAVFAAIGGWLLLGESLGARESAGCALMLVGVVLSQLGRSEGG